MDLKDKIETVLKTRFGRNSTVYVHRPDDRWNILVVSELIDTPSRESSRYVYEVLEHHLDEHELSLIGTIIFYHPKELV